MFTYGKAICYQGYRKNQSPIKNMYPSKSEVLEDLLILDKEFDYIRVYDTSQHTRDILEVIYEHKIDIKVMLSMYMYAEENHINHPFFNEISVDVLNLNMQKNTDLCKEIINLANKYPTIVFSISVGNEARSTWNVNRVSDKRISELVNIIKKEVIQPVTFCEEWKYWLTDLDLTAKSVDFISIHSYPVWNHVDINNAIAETAKHLKEVKNVYPDKEIVITEAGWPTKTDENKIPRAWATIENQKKYYNDMNIWAKEHNVLVFFFEAFDELWKGSNNSSDPEKNWGLYNENRSKKCKV
jgi:exo-beta-1,3-glucanase (GH17 family)